MHRSTRTTSAFIRLLAAVVALLGGLGALMTPAVSSAADLVRLSITPVGVPGSYFTLTAAPGTRPQLTVQLGNTGTSTMRARTFAADAYTIVNGGYGTRLDGEATSGTTAWLDYAPQTLDLAAGASVQRSFVVAVPADAPPGEYQTSLVLQNAKPVAGHGSQGEGGFAFRQVIRQVIAVAIIVPGPQLPGLAIGAASHHTVAGTSSIAIAVRNTGNVRLQPAGEFVLRDATGTEVRRSPIQMDSFYAGTDTFVEIPLAQRRTAGAYTVTLSLADATGVAVASGPLPVSVPTAVEDAAVPQPPVETVTVPQSATVSQGAAAGGAVQPPGLAMPASPLVWALGGLALLVVALGAGLGVGLLIRRWPPPSGVQGDRP